MGLRRKVIRWVVAMFAVPVAAEAAERLGRVLEEQRGPSRWSRGLRGGAVRLRRLQGSRRRRRW